MDKVTEQKIQTLHPSLREEVIKIINECDTLLTGKARVRIAQALRTEKEQNDLYAQGRTTPGKIVTKCKFGQSFHCFGAAIDFVLIIDGKVASWDTKSDFDGDKVSDWMEVVKVFKKYGWKWGGEFRSFVDLPHVEKSKYTWQQLLAKYNTKDFIPGTTYLKEI
jgi:peptidoglycan L-alanyl-D-glutamate endopeptidase CwlK